MLIFVILNNDVYFKIFDVIEEFDGVGEEEE